MAWARFGFAGSGDDLPTDDWMDERNAQVADRDALDAAGREAWEASTRSGDNLQAAQSSDVAGLGAASLRPNGEGQAGAVEPKPSGEAPNMHDGTTVDPSKQPVRYRRRAASANYDQFSDRLTRGLNVWTGRDPYGASSAASPQQGSRPSWVDRSVPLKAAAGTGAFVAGLPYGFMRGGVRLGQDIGNTVDFGMRLADPNDAQNHPLDEPARDVVKDAGRNVVSYAKSVSADPRIAVRDAGNLLQNVNVSLNPFATPMASSLSDEMRRDFGVGANWGELGLQVGTALEGGGEAAALRAAKPLTEAQKADKLVSEGFDRTTALHLAAPYEDGMGSHYLARKTRIPALSSNPLPKRFMDSPFNVSKPAGMSRDEFYRYHYAVDPSFNGAKLPVGMKGLNGHPGWRGSDLELTRYGPLGRTWYGAPAALKRAAGAVGMTPGFAAYDFGGDDPE